MDRIHVIVTGGTIDSQYDGTKDTVVPREHSVLPEYFKSLQLHTETTTTELCMKDSRDLTDADRKAILDCIRSSPEKYFLVTHGTYTMPITAKFLSDAMKDEDKVVVLTGSMIPLSGMTPSDGGFNLGFVFGKISSLIPGVYVAMNGITFAADSVFKNTSIGRFESGQGQNIPNAS